MPDHSSHFDAGGNAHLVDVSAKPVTARRAVATGAVQMKLATADMIRGGAARKGDVLGIARLAAIQATKLTYQLIPLCHAIPIEAVSVEFQWQPDRSDSALLVCTVTVSTSAKTGVEMEAMSAVSIACLTVYDMIKSVDRGVSIGPLRLIQKSGGKSGDYQRPAETATSGKP